MLDMLPFLQAIFYALKLLLPFFLIAIIFELLRKLPTLVSEYRAQKTGISDLDNLSGREFEIWLAGFFKRMGYKNVKLLRESKDYGADILVTNTQGKCWAIQAKKRTGSNVGVSAIGEVLRGKRWYKCDYAMVITNSGFTKQAWDEAAACGVTLWDRRELIKISEEIKS